MEDTLGFVTLSSLSTRSWNSLATALFFWNLEKEPTVDFKLVSRIKDLLEDMPISLLKGEGLLSRIGLIVTFRGEEGIDFGDSFVLFNIDLKTSPVPDPGDGA